MIVKTTFKSHFKFKKFSKKDEKKIFVKNIIIFLLFSKIFFKNCKISLIFLKQQQQRTSILKAPSRHKKYFHQLCHEIFFLKIFFKFPFKVILTKMLSLKLFPILNAIFLKIGSNILTRIKFTVSTKNQIKNLDLF